MICTSFNNHDNNKIVDVLDTAQQKVIELGSFVKTHRSGSQK